METAQTTIDYLRDELGVTECGLDLSRQMIAGRRQWIVHPLDDGECYAVFEHVDNGLCGEGTEAINVQTAFSVISRVRWLPVVESGSSMRSITENALQSFKASTI